MRRNELSNDLGMTEKTAKHFECSFVLDAARIGQGRTLHLIYVSYISVRHPHHLNYQAKSLQMKTHKSLLISFNSLNLKIYESMNKIQMESEARER